MRDREAHPVRRQSEIVDAAPALAINGVAEVVQTPSGVAVLAKGYWPARQGADALKIEWDETGTESRSTQQIIDDCKGLVKNRGAVAASKGNTARAFAKAATIIEAIYTFPYLAHAPMEPNDCVIRRTEGIEPSARSFKPWTRKQLRRSWG